MPAEVDIDATMQKYVQAFRAIKARDLAEQPSWAANWLYDRDYAIYKSPQDLIRWFEWFRPEECAHYLPEERISLLTDESESHSRRILSPILSGEYKYRHVDEYNAVDFILQSLYPVPPRMRPKRVLDFGAGYGRQMNLWSRVADLTYVAVDSVELPYTLQSFYFTQFSLPVYEYATGHSNVVGGESGIYHIPTWRTDLLPDAFFDLVICTQVLQEIPASLVDTAIHTFKRCVKPGGAVYVRDHGLATQSMHNVDVNAAFCKNGFVLEFCPYVRDHLWWLKSEFHPDLHGIPRVFRRLDPSYPVFDSQMPGSSEVLRKVRRFVSEADSRCGGILHWLLGK